MRRPSNPIIHRSKSQLLLAGHLLVLDLKVNVHSKKHARFQLTQQVP
jgi:hypothetical protein